MGDAERQRMLQGQYGQDPHGQDPYATRQGDMQQQQSNYPQGQQGGHQQGGYDQRGGGYGQQQGPGGGSQQAGRDDGYGQQDQGQHGGAGQYGNVPTDGKGQWKNMWFGTSLGMAAMAMFGIIWCFFSLQWVDGVEFMYLFIFSMTMACDSTPVCKQVMFVSKFRYGVGIYVHALTRITFKGCFFLFLGSSLISSSLMNFPSFFGTLGAIAGVLGWLIGLLSVVAGVMKSCMLKTCRQKIFDASQGQPGRLEDDFRRYARNKDYLEPKEFVELCYSFTKVQWKDQDTHLICNALAVSDPRRQFMYSSDFMNWVMNSGVTIL